MKSSPSILRPEWRPLGPLAALRRFLRPPPEPHRCELCGISLADEHPHLLNLKSREVACSCDACALLFADARAGGFRRIGRRIQFLPDFVMSDAQWEALGLPIRLAFFVPREEGHVAALYPSPAGATESSLTLDLWEDLSRDNPVLKTLTSEVEALLVNRIHTRREHFIVSIDHCYRLVGLIRTHWRGLSGGHEIWKHIDEFFAGLKKRS